MKESVYGKGEEYFSEDVIVGATRYFAYYVPIRNGEGEVVGVSFAGQPVDSVNISMKLMLQGNVIICIFIVLLTGFICHLAAGRIVEVIAHIRHFLGKLAQGRFGQEMPEVVLKRRDELGEMGKYAVTVSNSLEDMVTKDSLTGLLNRRACLMRVEECKECDAFTIALTDIDFFKKVNDSYGHDKGDEVLVYVSSVLQELAGEKGFVSRWGGEEFLLGFQEELTVVEDKINRAAQRIREREFTEKEEKFHVTITVGLVSYEPDLSFDENIKRADELLYYGKENGRNQIVISECLNA